MIGRGALDSLEQYRFDKCFMGVNGIHSQFGYTTPDPEEAMIKQLAISLSVKHMSWQMNRNSRKLLLQK